MNPESENEISYNVRGAILQVYKALGPGLLESAYKANLSYELSKYGYKVELEVPVPVIYDGVKLDIGFRIDILIENNVIIEVKSIEQLAPVHHKQVITYLKLSGKKLGLLVNFNSDDILNSISRKVNGL